MALVTASEIAVFTSAISCSVGFNGVIKEAFDEDSVPHKCADELDDMELADFIKGIEYPEDMSESMLPYSKERVIKAWKTFFKEFN